MPMSEKVLGALADQLDLAATVLRGATRTIS